MDQIWLYTYNKKEGYYIYLTHYEIYAFQKLTLKDDDTFSLLIHMFRNLNYRVSINVLEKQSKYLSKWLRTKSIYLLMP